MGVTGGLGGSSCALHQADSGPTGVARGEFLSGPQTEMTPRNRAGPLPPVHWDHSRITQGGRESGGGLRPLPAEDPVYRSGGEEGTPPCPPSATQATMPARPGGIGQGGCLSALIATEVPECEFPWVSEVGESRSPGPRVHGAGERGAAGGSKGHRGLWGRDPRQVVGQPTSLRLPKGAEGRGEGGSRLPVASQGGPGPPWPLPS